MTIHPKHPLAKPARLSIGSAVVGEGSNLSQKNPKSLLSRIQWVADFRYLTHEQVKILLDLRKFAQEKQSLTGERHKTVVVPSDIFDRLILGLGEYIVAKSPTPTVLYGPRKIIADAVERVTAEYIRNNPDKQDAEHLRMIRISAENTAIIDYLQDLYDRGKL